jgi:hypothetical protein
MGVRGGVGAADEGEEREEVAAGVGGTEWADEESRSMSNSMSSEESNVRCGCCCCCCCCCG